MKRATAQQLVVALVTTSDRYVRGMMCDSTFRTHNRALWAQAQRTPQMFQRVSRLLREHIALQQRATLSLVKR